MSMPRTGRRDGLTLIEILLAIIVMALGLVGILALFPPALEQANESMEETQAAILGESVSHALVSAFRNALVDPQTKDVVVYLAHDLEAGGHKGRYEFVLPKGDQPNAAGEYKWYHFPSSANPPPRDQGSPVPMPGWDATTDERHFKLGANGWTKATTDHVKQNFDDTDVLSQFQFSFNLTKVPTLAYLRKAQAGPVDPAAPPLPKAEQIEAMEKLYEIKIFILRVADDPGGGSPNRKPIAVITKRIISK
jgi:type II secretory pathway pseudopilin PulG